MQLWELIPGSLIPAVLVYCLAPLVQGSSKAIVEPTRFVVPDSTALTPTAVGGLGKVLASDTSLVGTGPETKTTTFPAVPTVFAPKELFFPEVSVSEAFPSTVPVSSSRLLREVKSSEPTQNASPTPLKALEPELSTELGSTISSPISTRTSCSYIPPLDDLLIPAKSPARTTPLTVAEAARICQTPFFAQTIENWVTSGSADFLEEYTTATHGDFLRQKHGLIGSMAYRFLGEENFRCSVGMTQGCTISCKDVVMAVEDLYEARNVYFILSSVAHFTAVTDLIHSGLALAQNNVGLMAPKMAFSLFWSKTHTDSDTVHFILNLIISGIAQIFQFFTPFIPFVQVIDNLHTKLMNFDVDLAHRAEMEHMAWLFLRTANMFEAVYSHEWPGTLKKQIEPQQQLGFYAHITGLRGDREATYYGRTYNSLEKHWWLYNGVERETEKQPDGRAWKAGNNNILDKLTRKGWKRRDAELFEREGGPAHPPSHTEYAWGGIYQEENNKLAAMREFKQNADSKMLMMKNNAQRLGISVFTGWLPQILGGISNWLAWEEDESAQDINMAYLAMKIQDTTREARVQLKKAYDDLMNPSEYRPDGETMLSHVLGSGHYLPSNAYMIKDFTDHDVENKITKNIFHKALNTALKSQKVYITCTPDLQKRKKPHHKSGVTASSCKNDNSGPEDLKACITTTPEQSRARGLGDEPVELACYMYKWATRGDASRHYNERPAGSDTWEDDWGVLPKDVIVSSVKSHLDEMDDTSLMISMEERRSPESLADPSAAGVFTIPVCISRHNWNNGIREFGYFDKLDPFTSKKNLPCSCGFWGDETEQVWKDMGIWDTHKSYYRTELCQNQRSNHMDDPLEVYVNNCRLESRKGVFKPRFGKDGLCDIVMNILEELRKRGYDEELTREVRDTIYCRIYNGKACKNVKTDEPFSTILEQLEDKPYVREAPVPATVKQAVEALEIADGLYSMSLSLALTGEQERSIEAAAAEGKQPAKGYSKRLGSSKEVAGRGA